MNSQTLERLLIDRAVGALPADTAALLQAYLDARPETAAEADLLAQAVDLARRAMADDAEPSLPPFPAFHLQRVQRSQRRWRQWRTVAVAAACLLIGVGLTSAIFISSRSPTGPVVIHDPPDPVSPDLVVMDDRPRDNASSATDVGFWSTRQLYEQLKKPSRSGSSRTISRWSLNVTQQGDST